MLKRTHRNISSPPIPRKLHRPFRKLFYQLNAILSCVIIPSNYPLDCLVSTGHKLQSQKYTYTSRVIGGLAINVLSRTTPNVPPPPPRRAKNRSGSWHWFTVRYFPSGVTILNCSTRSTPSPSAGDNALCPPPFWNTTLEHKFDPTFNMTYHDPSTRCANGGVCTAHERDIVFAGKIEDSFKVLSSLGVITL